MRSKTFQGAKTEIYLIVRFPFLSQVIDEVKGCILSQESRHFIEFNRDIYVLLASCSENSKYLHTLLELLFPWCVWVNK